MKTLISLLLAAMTATAAESVRPDIVVGDFETTNWPSGWIVTGDAFGPGPKIPADQRTKHLGGWIGTGFVTTRDAGQKAMGELLLPPFQVERDYLNFRLEGGYLPGKITVELLVDDKVVRSATGRNIEFMEDVSFDLKDLKGKSARLRLADRSDNGWGVMVADHFVLSDGATAPEVIAGPEDFPFTPGPVVVEVPVKGRYLNVPVEYGVRGTYISGKVDGEKWPLFACSTPLAWRKVDTYFIVDVGDYTGRTVKVFFNMRYPKLAKERLITANEILDAKDLYQEKYRPQFHFTGRRGDLNDPNGLVYYKGEWHLMFQYRPLNGRPTSWGHAVSKNLFSWEELPLSIDAIRGPGGEAWSGSAVVDWNNTLGLQVGKDKTLAILYTQIGVSGQSLVTSTDRGRSWTWHEKNPVLTQIYAGNRDPKVIWHEPTKKWIMALWITGGDYALFGSSDLKQWTKLCDVLKAGGECPDFFPMRLDGDPNKVKWVFVNGDGRYLVGVFDGTTFKPETGLIQANYGSHFYATQTWSDAPDAEGKSPVLPEAGRRVQIAWMPGSRVKGMPFSEQMTVPCELTLRSTAAGPRIFSLPVKELDALRKTKHEFRDLALETGKNPLEKIQGDLFDIQAEFDLGTASEVGFKIRGVPVVYDRKNGNLRVSLEENRQTTARMAPVDGKVALRIVVDRTTIEVFGNNGEVAMAHFVVPVDENRTLEVFSTGGVATATALQVYELKSAWGL